MTGLSESLKLETLHFAARRQKNLDWTSFSTT
eukprot:CAMPEP_0185579888 /NCGR_PEP_ID=MMETSP0434-20130131/15472_1 /TAXON_ID=626734 ORGANISM="Favella taraikaensis, Strain Fe Narragansett Bay" /NCGR_SAMPLE_ID=MMETSP0434 /ASSEMBLY_ACC=CAM_ASM_000379 /LENGTH=31 /DNA_ID= /DNA_START= /DNA_END= /DNA_ORIENTATION=